MIFSFSRKTAPTSEPISLAEFKIQIRHVLASDDTTEDVLLARCLAAGRGWVETYTMRSLMTQTWQMSLEAFPACVWLPRSTPLASITHVKYYDTSNALQTLSADTYTTPAFAMPAYVKLADTYAWPVTALRDDAVQIEYVTGASSAANVDTALVQAVVLLASHFYSQREPGGVLPAEVQAAAETLCSQLRAYWREPEAA